jgi:hypothetical protein
VRRALAIALLAAALVAPTAQAHRYLTVNSTTAYYERKLETRIGDYRLAHGRFPLFNALNLHLAGISLSWANYDEAKFTTRINGVPWPSWNDNFLTPTQQLFPSAMMIGNRCYGLPLTPRQLLDRWTKKTAYRSWLLSPTVYTIGVRVAYVHRHVGYYAGKGRCTNYYVSVAR